MYRGRKREGMRRGVGDDGVRMTDGKAWLSGPGQDSQSKQYRGKEAQWFLLLLGEARF